MLQPTSFGTYIETGVDSEDDSGSQGQYREERRETRGEMTLTVEYSEMTATNVEHFKITATTNANWVIPARTQEEYKQKKSSRHASMLTHTRSDTLAPWPTWQLARTYISTLLTRLGKKSSSCTTLWKKKPMKTCPKGRIMWEELWLHTQDEGLSLILAFF